MMTGSSKSASGSQADAQSKTTSWFERNVNLISIGLLVACGLTLVAQWYPGLGYDEHHPAHFPQEQWFGFQAAFGFVAFVVIVFLGRGLRLIVKRPEDYYDA
jgi:uncharacterized membrane protein